MNPQPSRPSRGKSWLTHWEPENPEFWESTGKTIARTALVVTTANLFLAFITWFVVSALVVKLPQIGFRLSTSELFWLTAIPGLAAGLWRLVHMFLTPVLGTRFVVSAATLLLLIPLVGWYFAVQDPTTNFWVLALLAFCAGMGGGNFSSFMPSTNLFFPKRRIGTALAIQAGVGNLGVSVVQFLTPWVIGFALAGSLFGGPQTLTPPGGTPVPVYLQNALTLYIPLVVIGGLFAWILLRSVPIQSNFREQFDIFANPHTWSMTSIYLMTFGAFSGLAGTFPLLIKQTFGGLPNPPDPLAFAFLGPLVGAVLRIAAGPLADRWGGARLTTLSGIGMTVCAALTLAFTQPTAASFPWFVGSMLGIFFFAGIGNASTFKQMPMLFPPRPASGVIGFTAAIAAFGPFIYGLMFAASFALFQSAHAVFACSVGFFGFNTALNWWMYSRKGAKNPC